MSILCASLTWLTATTQDEVHNVPTKRSETVSWIEKKISRESSAEYKVSKAHRLAPNKYRPKLFYCTRTHSQISEVVGELKKTVFKDHVSCLILSSRKKLCINSVVSKSTDVNDACTTLLESESKCPYFKPELLESQSEFLADNFRKDSWNNIEDLKKEGLRLSLCPYFASRSLVDSADVLHK